MTEIELTMALNHRYMGAYHPDNKNLIWLNVAEIWEWAAKNSPKRATQDDVEEWFTKKLYAIFLQERVCITKHNDKLRIKGGACSPYCHHEKIVDYMISPDEWADIKRFHEHKYKIYTEEEI